MQNTVDLKENRRAEKRFLVFIQARFLVAHSQRYKECIIIDISRTGACAKLPRGEIVTIGGEIFLNLTPFGRTTNIGLMKRQRMRSFKAQDGTASLVSLYIYLFFHVFAFPNHLSPKKGISYTIELPTKDLENGTIKGEIVW